MSKKFKGIEITDFNDDSEEVSKTKKKQMAFELRDLAKAITEMPKSKLVQLELPQTFTDAISEAHRIKSHIAKKRHFQYMGKLLIKMDHVSIQEQLNRLNNLDGHYQIRDEIITLWIAHLITDEKIMFEHLYSLYDHDVINPLRQLLRNHLKKPDNAINRKKLFQALRKVDQISELPNPMLVLNS